MRIQVYVCFVFLSVSTLAHAQTIEQQTHNADVNGGDWWQPSANTSPKQLKTDNGFLSVSGTGGAGQFYGINGKSKYQIATCKALKSTSSWTGFGVTYYDYNGVEVGIQQKQILSDIRDGGQETRYSIGLVVPENATYAYLWVWKDGGEADGYVQLDDFRVVNYFPDSNASYDPTAEFGNQFTQTFPLLRNLLVNGSFETYGFDGTEFWNVEEINDSVYRNFDTSFDGLRVGSPNGDNLVYQVVYDIKPNSDYIMKIRAGVVGQPVAVIGADIRDGSGTKVDAAMTAIQGPLESNEEIYFRTPSNVGSVSVWIWTPAASSSSALWVNSIKLQELIALP